VYIDYSRFYLGIRIQPNSARILYHWKMTYAKDTQFAEKRGGSEGNSIFIFMLKYFIYS
jgi:hypothetical protein